MSSVQDVKEELGKTLSDSAESTIERLQSLKIGTEGAAESAPPDNAKGAKPSSADSLASIADDLDVNISLQIERFNELTARVATLDAAAKKFFETMYANVEQMKDKKAVENERKRIDQSKADYEAALQGILATLAKIKDIISKNTDLSLILANASLRSKVFDITKELTALNMEAQGILQKLQLYLTQSEKAVFGS
jgi:hypothetical protein